MNSNLPYGLPSPKTHAFSALRKRNVRLYMIGMFVSQSGTAMQVLAQAWLVYELTNSAFQLGLVGFVSGIPLLPWSLWIGAVSDRVPRHKLLAIALVGEAIPPFILAALVWAGQAQVWHVILVSVLLGAMGSVDFVSRMPLIQSMVEPDELQSGFALATSFMNVARIIGPAIGGVLIATVGVAGAFVFNGLSFLFALFMLAQMQIQKRPQLKPHRSLATALVETPLFILNDRLVLIFILMVLMGSFFILSTLTLLPIFARDILIVGPQGLGLLSAASGVGAVLGAAILASSPQMTLHVRLFLSPCLMLAAALLAIAFSFSRDFGLSACLLALLNGTFVAFRVVNFSHVYAHTPDSMRGRISSLLQISMNGTQSAGGLLSGFIASRTSTPQSVAFGGLMCLLSGLLATGFLLPVMRSKDKLAQPVTDGNVYRHGTD